MTSETRTNETRTTEQRAVLGHRSELERLELERLTHLRAHAATERRRSAHRRATLADARRLRTLRTARPSRTALMALSVFAVLAVACGGTTDGASPAGEPSAAGDTQPVCRPGLGPDDPHPILDGTTTGNNPAFGDLLWLEPVNEALQTTYADASGGLWLDQAAGEVVVMLATDDPGSVLRELRAIAADAGGAAVADTLVCMDATYTEAELLDLQARVAALSAGPSSSGIDTVRNRIDVAVEVEGEAVAGAIADTFTEREQAAIVLTVPPCAEIVPLPDGATALPGGGSTCQGMDALLEGELVVADGCAWISTGASPEEQVAVTWPRGWYLDADGAVHDHRGELRARPGDQIASGGGFTPADAGAEACWPTGVDATTAEGSWVLNSLDPRG